MNRYANLALATSCGICILYTWYSVVLPYVATPEEDYPVENADLLNLLASDVNKTVQTTKDGMPKIFHQVWLNYTALPLAWWRAIGVCKFKNIDFAYKLWSAVDIDRLLSRDYPWFVETYRGYQYPVQRADAARYFLLYHYGGVYLDMDIVCKTSFTDILENTTRLTRNAHVVLPMTEPVGLSNDFMASIPKHPFFRYVTGELGHHDKWYGLPYLTVLFSTGPSFLSSVYTSYSDKRDILLLSSALYGATFFEHIEGGTWHSFSSRAVYKLYRLATEHYIFLAILSAMLFFWWRRRCYMCYKARTKLHRDHKY